MELAAFDVISRDLGAAVRGLVKKAIALGAGARV